MDDFGNFVAVGALLDDEDDEVGVSFCETTSDDTSGQTSCKRLVREEVLWINERQQMAYLQR